MSGNLTRSELVGEIKGIEAIIAQWSENPEAPTDFHAGRQVRVISQLMSERWDNLGEMVAVDAVDDGAKRLVLLVDEFHDQLGRFEDKASSGASNVDPGGSTELWQAWENLITAAAQRAPEKKRIEPIAELKAQDVPVRQIAKIYDWFDRHGEPDVQKVYEELENPGTHYDPATHRTSHERKYDRQLAADWEARSSRRAVSGDERGPKSGRIPDPARESIQDLLEQQVSVKQIAIMKRVDEQTILDLARGLGINTGISAPPPALTPITEHERRLSVEKQRVEQAGIRAQQNARADRAAKNGAAADDDPAAKAVPRPAVDEISILETYAESDNAREQVRQMTWDGVEPDQIHEALAPQHPELSLNSVRQYARFARAEVNETPG